MKQRYTLADQHQQIEDIKELETLRNNTRMTDASYKQITDNLHVMWEVLQHIVEQIAAHEAARPKRGLKKRLKGRS